MKLDVSKDPEGRGETGAVDSSTASVLETLLSIDESFPVLAPTSE